MNVVSSAEREGGDQALVEKDKRSILLKTTPEELFRYPGEGGTVVADEKSSSAIPLGKFHSVECLPEVNGLPAICTFQFRPKTIC